VHLGYCSPLSRSSVDDCIIPHTCTGFLSLWCIHFYSSSFDLCFQLQLQSGVTTCVPDLHETNVLSILQLGPLSLCDTGILRSAHNFAISFAFFVSYFVTFHCRHWTRMSRTATSNLGLGLRLTAFNLRELHQAEVLRSRMSKVRQQRMLSIPSRDLRSDVVVLHCVCLCIYIVYFFVLQTDVARSIWTGTARFVIISLCISIMMMIVWLVGTYEFL
jgi:hypothetical protein